MRPTFLGWLYRRRLKSFIQEEVSQVPREFRGEVLNKHVSGAAASSHNYNLLGKQSTACAVEIIML